MKSNHLTVAIDGPASSGKSTVAKQIAKDLKLIYIDTGAMYRGLTYKALQADVDTKNEKELYHLLNKTKINFSIENDKQQVYVNNNNVTNEIRNNDVTNEVSIVSAHGKIREEMVSRQQKMSDEKSVIMDGRDIGTVVLPHATVKIYLNASVEERAERRYNENIEKGIESDYNQLVKEIEYRDYLDSNREFSPLVKADDANLIDTTKLTISEVTDRIKEVIENNK